MGYTDTSMVSAKDREHFQRIAAFEAELNREAIRESAARTPGENIALGFALSEFAVAFGADLSRPDDVSPARLWRERAASRTTREQA
jgi:hypothetical protein